MEGDVGFGQSYAAGGGSPGLAYHLGVEGGYIVPRDSWARLEPSFEAFFGHVGYREGGERGFKTSIPIGLGLLAKIGYGYSLGHDTVVTWKIGAGMVNAKFSADAASGAKVTGQDSMWGPIGQLAVALTMPVSGNMDLSGGIKYSHIALDVGDVKVDYNGATVDQNLGEPINLNVPEIYIGLRYRFSPMEELKSPGVLSEP